jgi:hypothetical protein
MDKNTIQSLLNDIEKIKYKLMTVPADQHTPVYWGAVRSVIRISSSLEQGDWLGIVVGWYELKAVLSIQLLYLIEDDRSSDVWMEIENIIGDYYPRLKPGASMA